MRTQALQIYMFDVLIENADRTTVHGKPNLFTNDRNLVILDHELAFAFLDLFFSSKTKPWEIGTNDVTWLKSHVLYNPLKGKSLDFSALNGFLQPLTQQFWLELRDIIPEIWIDEEAFVKIERHVSSVRDHEEEFIKQIKNILQ